MWGPSVRHVCNSPTRPIQNQNLVSDHDVWKQSFDLGSDVLGWCENAVGLLTSSRALYIGSISFIRGGLAGDNYLCWGTDFKECPFPEEQSGYIWLQHTNLATSNTLCRFPAVCLNCTRRYRRALLKHTVGNLSGPMQAGETCLRSQGLCNARV
jgi:hypothetical protein